jgi:hypothetical protein
LQNAVVFQLAADLVDAITTLRASIKGAGDPVLQLDRGVPGWRECVPLSLDDDAARALLVDLLRHVPRQASARAGMRILSVLRRLPAGTIRLERRALLLGRHPKKQLAHLFGRKEDDLPVRFFIDMVSADGARQQVGIAQQVAGDAEYEVVDLRSRPVSRPEAVTGEVLFLARTSTEELGVFLPDGGQALDAIPWWFTDEPDRDEQSFVGQGDLVTRRSSLLVVMPPGVAIESGQTEAVGVLEAPTAEIRRAVGACTWTSSDDAGAARVGAPEDAAPVVLVGDVRVAFTAGTSAWFGPPSLASRDGGPTSVQLEWRRTGGAWASMSDACMGRVALRAVQDGATLFRTITTVLPRDLTIASEPKTGKGTLRVHSSRLHGLRVEDCPAGVQAVVSQLATTAEVRVVANESIDLKLRLSLEAGAEAVVTVPSPVVAVCYLDRKGNPIPTRHQVSAQRLLGIRARVVAPNDSPPPTLLLRRFLRDEGRGHFLPIGLLRPTRDARTFELPLDDVRDIVLEHLAAGTHADDAVELVLAADAKATLLVRRYEAAFSLDAAGLPVRRLTLPADIEAKLEPHVISALEVSLVRTASPADPEVPLPRHADGSWHFVASDHAPGPWLVVARYGNAIRLRPVLVTNRPNEVIEGQPGTLDHALLCPVREERFRRLVAFFDALAPGFSDRDWTRLAPFVATLGQFPATTFDVVRRIASHGALAAYALLKADDGAFMRVWNGLEELPFMWHLVPIPAWVKAVRVLYAERRRTTVELKRLGIPLELPDAFVPWRSNPLARFLDVLRDLFVATVMGVDETSMRWVRDAREAEGRALALERLKSAVEPLQHSMRTELSEDLTRALLPGGAALEGLVRLQDIIRRDGYRRAGVYSGMFLPDFGARLDSRPSPAGRVAYAAALSAAYAFTGDTPSLDVLFALRGYRSVAYELFDMAHATYLTLLVGARLATDKEYLDDV